MRFKKFIILLVIFLLLSLNISVSYSVTEKPKILAEAAILIDSSTEKILYSKNETEILYPASTTKVLSAILTIENCNLDDIVTVPYEAISTIPSGYTVADLQVGEKLTIRQVLELALVPSANDAANTLAFCVCDSIENFADLMNKKVSDLGLTNTHFTNPSGIHDDNHYSTAYDLAMIMKYCMKNPTFRSLAGMKYCTIPSTNKYEERVFTTTNELLLRNNSSNYFYEFTIAGKTGYTTKAKNCLISVSNKDDFELICVVLSSGMYPNNLSGRFVDSKKLFEYGYSNYALGKLRDKNAIATQVEIKNGSKETKDLNLLISNDITAVIPQDNLNSQFNAEIYVDENLLAPISQGQIVGKITYDIDGIKYSSDLVAEHSVEVSSFFILVVQIFIVVLILFILYKLLFHTDKNK